MTGPLRAAPPSARSAEALFREWAPSVARVLARLGVPRRDLDDAVQEVFLTAHRRGGYVSGDAKPQTWLYEIALRVASNVRRRDRRKPACEIEATLDVAASAGRDPHESAELRQQLERVAAAIEQIPGEAKLTFVLAEIEGASADEVARAQGIPLGTVYSRLHHARRAFRAAYAALAEAPEAGLYARIKARLEGLRSPIAAPPGERTAR